MGDFKGHALPGSLFLLYGMWWAVCVTKRYLLCRRAGSRYISSATFPCPCACGPLTRLPIEGFIKVGLTGFGMLAEIIFNLPHPSMGIIQHATMYFFFLMSGIVDIASHYGAPLPPATDYIALTLAFAVEGLLFANHLHGRPMVDVHIHVLLVYVIALTVVCLILEAKFQKSSLLSMARAYLVMLQGSWFWGVGVILYGHPNDKTAWKLDDEMGVMQATIYFSWHCAFHFILLFVVFVVMGCIYRMPPGARLNGNGVENGPKQEEYRMLKIEDDEDVSDIEFEKPVTKGFTS
ncbi:transmembrane protein 45B [Biomphalaria glabrata]|nr:transmembrane protein 45B [Biomphalaria glabrata]